MKKALLILAVLFVILSPKTSFSQNEILLKEINSIRNELDSASSNLFQICRDLTQIIKSLSLYGDYNYDLEAVGSEIELLYATIHYINGVAYRCSHESEILWMFPLIKEKYKKLFCDYEIENLIENKDSIMFKIEGIEMIYPRIKNNAALYLIDKGKGIISSSLKSFDKSIEALQLIKDSMK